MLERYYISSLERDLVSVVISVFVHVECTKRIQHLCEFEAFADEGLAKDRHQQSPPNK